MNKLFRLSWRTWAMPQLLTLLLTLFSGSMFVILPVNSELSSTIIALGLDPLRTQLLTALLLTVGAACVGAFIGHRKAGALLGSAIFFCWIYLLGFVQTERQPVRDPLGDLEPLNRVALFHTSLMMLALALLGAFIGAAAGQVASEVLFDPLLPLIRSLWQHAFFRRLFRARSEQTALTIVPDVDRNQRKKRVVSWLNALLFASICVLATTSSDLFLYTPDIGLHTAPVLALGRPLGMGTVVKDSVVSKALGGEQKPFFIYLPPSYNTPQGRLKRYPTLYLLHGSPGSDSDWITGGKVVQAANTLISLGRIEELILVMPDGNGHPGQSSEWGNSADGHQNIETYVAEDLVAYVDARYRTIPQSSERGIGGLSMGGFGATNIAVHYPNTFGFVISLGGYYRAEGAIWGKVPAYLRANSPLSVLPTDKSDWHLQFYLGAATRDQPYYTDTQQFAQELWHLHLPYALDIQRGYHDWKIWQTQMYDALPWLRWGS